MELQFVGDIKAVRVGDKFKAYGTLQSRKTGNYIRVETEVDIPALLAEARAVYKAARAYLSAQGKEVEALPEGGIEGMGLDWKNLLDPAHIFHKDSQGTSSQGTSGGGLAEALKRRAKGQSLSSQQLALVQQYDRSNKQLTSAQKKLADEKKKEIVQAKMRAEANRRLNERRIERKGYEDKIVELKKQIADSAADATRQAELQAQADQYEARMVQMDEASANMQAQYENQIAQIQAMPAEQVAELPQAAAISEQVDSLVASAQELAGMGSAWSWLKNVAKKFKKALAVVFRSKIVKGLVTAAATVYGGPAGKAAVDAAYGGGKKDGDKDTPPKLLGTKVWMVPGLGVSAENARTWIRTLEWAKPPRSDVRCIKILNRVKIMARMHHPAATKTFWLLRDIERLLPEVKNQILASGGDPTTALLGGSDREPGAVPTLMGLGDLGAEPTMPVQVKCMGFNPATLGWEQIPFSMALGKKHASKAQLAAMKAKAAQRKAAQARAAQSRQAQNQPTAMTAPAQSMMPNMQVNPNLPGGYAQPNTPYYGQPNYGQPDYSQAQNQPGFDPYSASSYGFDPNQFAESPDEAAMFAEDTGLMGAVALSQTSPAAQQALTARMQQRAVAPGVFHPVSPTGFPTAYNPYGGYPQSQYGGYPSDPYAGIDPYSAAYAATQYGADPYASAEVTPGFDPYSPASYGY